MVWWWWYDADDMMMIMMMMMMKVCTCGTKLCLVLWGLAAGRLREFEFDPTAGLQQHKWFVQFRLIFFAIFVHTYCLPMPYVNLFLKRNDLHCLALTGIWCWRLEQVVLAEFALAWEYSLVIVIMIIDTNMIMIVISLYLLSDSMKVWLYQLLQGPSTFSCLEKSC